MIPRQIHLPHGALKLRRPETYRLQQLHAGASSEASAAVNATAAEDREIAPRKTAAAAAATDNADTACPASFSGRTSTSFARRSAMLLGLSALTQPLRSNSYAMASVGAGIGPSSSKFDLDASDFYAQWQYSKPTDILPYLYATATKGDTSSVLRAIDNFSIRYPMYCVGPEKGALLEALARQMQPKLVVELGTFVGYSAIRLARNLAPGGRLVCVEGSQEAVDAATEVLKFAGLWNDPKRSVVIEHGRTSDVLPDLHLRIEGPAQIVFEDHCKPCYLPDLLTMERTGLIDEGTMVIADNVVYPGAPEYLAYLRNPANGYAAALIKARYEYDQKWKADWEPKMDALSVAVRGRPEEIVSNTLPDTSNITVLPARGTNPPSFGVRQTPPEALREAALRLQELCHSLPNGKRCAPVPAVTGGIF